MYIIGFFTTVTILMYNFFAKEKNLDLFSPSEDRSYYLNYFPGELDVNYKILF